MNDWLSEADVARIEAEVMRRITLATRHSQLGEGEVWRVMSRTPQGAVELLLATLPRRHE